MKKIKVLTFIFLLIGFITFGVQAEAANHIEKYDIELNVNENGSIDVKQKLRVNFTESSHGIFASIPQKYTMRWDENTTKEYFFPVKNIEVEDHKYEVTKSDEGVIIKIGDADIYVDGIVNYKYSYTIQTKDLDYQQQQMLYFNLVGSQWQMPINESVFKINMPKSFSESPKFYPPSQDDLQYLDYTVENNTISGKYSKEIGYGSALTILLPLSDDYFVFPTNTKAAITFTGLFVIFTLIVGTLFIKFGKDDPLIKTVEFNAPKGMSSAQVGYVIDGSIESKDTISLIVYWASQGYLHIKDKGKKDFELIKVKDISSTELSYEQALFNELFKKSDTVTKKKIPDSFAEMAVSNASSEYKDYFSGEKALFETFSSRIKGLLFVIMSLLNTIMAIYFVNLYYDMFFYNALFGGIVFVISLLLGLVINTSLTNRKARLKRTNFFRTVAMIIYSIIFVVLYAAILSNVEVNGIIILISIALTFINYVLIAFMTKRTKQGNLWLGQILGFKDFMLYAEKERIEMLVSENPHYFFDILPYAYVLGVSNKWIKKFEGIKLEKPDWYITDRPMSDLIFLSYLNNTMNSVNSSVVQINAGDLSSSGGLSSGGGGFSGGGFGGGGGGSW